MKILNQVNPDNVVFIDIETVAATPKLTKDHPLWDAWRYKMEHGRDPIGGDDVAGSYIEQAALYAEFGKIVCITIGKIINNKLNLKSYYGDDERALLADFCSALNNVIAANKSTVLCGHAIKGFDLPWIMRRCLVHGIDLPTLIDTAHLKPWETTAIDTMELWKGTGFNGGSLIAIAACMGIPNPKDDIEGFETTGVYYNEKDGLNRIERYCRKDVTTVANIFRKLRYEPLLITGDDDIRVEKVGELQKAFNTGKFDEKAVSVGYRALKPNEKAIANEIIGIIKN